MNVLLVSADSAIGGLASHIRDLALGLREFNHKIFVAAPTGPLFQSLKNKTNITPIRFDVKSRFDLGAIRNLRKLYRALADDNNIIIHTQGVRGGFIGRTAAIGLKLPLVYTEHLWTEDYLPPKAYKKHEQLFLMRQLDKITDHTIAVSKAVKEFLVSENVTTSEKVSVVYHGLRNQPPAAFPSNKSLPVFGFAGSLNQTKRLDILLRSAALLNNDGLQFKLQIIGQGEEKEALRRLARTLEIEDKIEWIDATEDPYQYMKNWWLTIITSESESFSLLALSSQAMGIPVVASAVGGLTEVIKSGKTGILVEKDNPPAVKQAILDLLPIPKHSDFAVAGREWAREQFSFEKMIRGTIAGYEEAKEFNKKRLLAK